MTNLENIFDKRIKCFQHCTKQIRYLCFELPDTCPNCSIVLKKGTAFRVPPFILPISLITKIQEIFDLNFCQSI